MFRRGIRRALSSLGTETISPRPASGLKASAKRRRRLRLEMLEDRLTLSAFVVTNTLGGFDSGSLMWAVEQANADPAHDTITF